MWKNLRACSSVLPLLLKRFESIAFVFILAKNVASHSPSATPQPWASWQTRSLLRKGRPPPHKEGLCPTARAWLSGFSCFSVSCRDPRLPGGCPHVCGNDCGMALWSPLNCRGDSIVSWAASRPGGVTAAPLPELAPGALGAPCCWPDCGLWVRLVRLWPPPCSLWGGLISPSPLTKENGQRDSR